MTPSVQRQVLLEARPAGIPQAEHFEDILDGIEHAPGAIAGLYRGENLGKRLIRLVSETEDPST